ncbi:Pectinesterase, catalytic [Corchorus olitorius]|uniref:Pectinesterase, catalytic n=1 Tax=Corchorus olitorius TaxID=93759 RepID=A0A1R3IHV3_9ROSI|nr:Pectinesterase, catalytic [Corchorus olitorius]
MKQAIMFLAVLTVCWQARGKFIPPFVAFDVIIAQDGSGDFTTISQGISSAPNFSPTRFYIKLEQGIYNENIVIPKEKTNLTLVGEDMETTIITGSRSYNDSITTFETATMAVFQNCQISPRKPLAGQSNTVTAQGRKESGGKGGFVIHNCKIRATSDLVTSTYPVRTYLGRPWRDFSRTVVMQSYLDSNIDPQGWMEFDERSSKLDLYYAEYDNRGPGSATYWRVKWKGFRLIDYVEAYQFTVREFIHGDMWIPATGVPYDPDYIDWSGSLKRSFSWIKMFLLVLGILVTLLI